MENLQKITGWDVVIDDCGKTFRGRIAANEIKIVVLDGWQLHKLNSKQFSPKAKLLMYEALYN
jgi:hypothetical protein